MDDNNGYACERVGMVMPWRCCDCACWPAPVRESRSTDALFDGSNAHYLCSACGGTGRVYDGERCIFCDGTGVDLESRTTDGKATDRKSRTVDDEIGKKVAK